MENESFDISWENNIYGQKKHFNDYPFDILVSIIAHRFYKIPLEKRKDIRILDLGCGAGNNSKFLSEKGFSVYGVDGSKSAIDYCRRKFKTLNLEGTFEVADFTNLPFNDSFFDCVIDRESLCANTGNVIRKVINDVYDKLKPNGVFLSFMYNEDHPDIKYGEKLEGATYHKFTAGSFQDIGKLHVTNIEEIREFFKKFKILSITQHTVKDIFSIKKVVGNYDEYIIITEK